MGRAAPLEALARARGGGGGDGKELPDRELADFLWESDALGEEVRQGDSAAFKRSLRLLRSVANKEGWKHWAAYRAANLSRVLRAVERVLGERYAGREKQKRRWLVRAQIGDQIVVAVELELAPLRKRDDFKKPLQIVVRSPDILDVVALERELRLRPRHRATAPALDTRLPRPPKE
jgi:hypothetical protein